MDFIDHHAAMMLPQVAQEDQTILDKPRRSPSRYVNILDALAEQNVAQKHHSWPPAIMSFCEMQMKQGKWAIISESHKVGHEAA